MATVADKFPTPCAASFWTPDSEDHQQRQPEAVLHKLSEAYPTATIMRPAVAVAPESDREGSGAGGDVCSVGSSVPHPETTADRGIMLKI